MNLEALRQEVLALSALRKQVMRNSDVIGRVFAPLLDTGGPTQEDVDRAIVALAEKVAPWFYVWYSHEEGCYVLCPYASLSERNAHNG